MHSLKLPHALIVCLKKLYGHQLPVNVLEGVELESLSLSDQLT